MSAARKECANKDSIPNLFLLTVERGKKETCVLGKRVF